MSAEDIDALIRGLRNRLGRLPTEDEVKTFIFGSAEERQEIWNKEVN